MLGTGAELDPAGVLIKKSLKNTTNDAVLRLQLWTRGASRDDTANNVADSTRLHGLQKAHRTVSSANCSASTT